MFSFQHSKYLRASNFLQVINSKCHPFIFVITNIFRLISTILVTKIYYAPSPFLTYLLFHCTCYLYCPIFSFLQLGVIYSISIVFTGYSLIRVLNVAKSRNKTSFIYIDLKMLLILAFPLLFSYLLQFSVHFEFNPPNFSHSSS